MPVWALYAGGALLVTAVGFGTGWEVRSWKADSDKLAAVEAGIKQGKKDQQLADYQAGRYEDQRNDAQQAAVQRETEIRTIYRDHRVEVPAECEPPAAALRVLDDAIGAANAQAAGQPRPEVSPDPGSAEPVSRPRPSNLGERPGRALRRLRSEAPVDGAGVAEGPRLT